MNYIFKEEQKFTQIWIWLPIIAFNLFFIYGIYQQIYLGEAYGSKPLSNEGLIAFAIGMFALTFFIWSIKLTTTIDSEGIKFNLFPLLRKEIKWNEVSSKEVIKYGFLGYGIRYGGSKYGWVYNIKGQKGLLLNLKNGKKILIGTQKEEELKNLISNLEK